MKPRIFIGSSTEGLPAAKRIKAFFETDYDCFIWNDGVFQFNESFIDTLLKSASLFDFGFMVFSADDISKIRDKEYETARDNVLFEYGLFLGRVGLDRAYVLCEDGVKIPTDFSGVTLASYKTEAGEPTDSLETTLSTLKKKVDEKVQLGHLGLLPSTVIAISYFENFIKLVTDYVMNNEGGIKIGGKTFKSVKIRIVIPCNLDADMKRHATLYFRKIKYESEVIPTNHRSYPIFVSASPDDNNKEDAIIADMPTILNGIDKAIDMYFKVGHIGKTKEQQLTEERELGNFVRVLQLLIQDDPYCKEIVEIVSENNEVITSILHAH